MSCTYLDCQTLGALHLPHHRPPLPNPPHLRSSIWSDALLDPSARLGRSARPSKGAEDWGPLRVVSYITRLYQAKNWEAGHAGQMEFR